jgi:hypothetical protein
MTRVDSSKGPPSGFVASRRRIGANEPAPAQRCDSRAGAALIRREPGSMSNSVNPSPPNPSRRRARHGAAPTTTPRTTPVGSEPRSHCRRAPGHRRMDLPRLRRPAGPADVTGVNAELTAAEMERLGRLTARAGRGDPSVPDHTSHDGTGETGDRLDQEAFRVGPVGRAGRSRDRPGRWSPAGHHSRGVGFRARSSAQSPDQDGRGPRQGPVPGPRTVHGDGPWQRHLFPDVPRPDPDRRRSRAAVGREVPTSTCGSTPCR